ncbi:MDR family MFS transporter [Nitrospirillum sp. BR 11164]|uniref:MDR family MFS transporter n=1 Tax=Nitrospirillum sp. BR 11164 TaxID=3104324 RepID=UPI002AFF4AA7|nr:MDR family MFS transporter [Nitrospirillum sp. BR 11164]MEA1648400.1 MDR family MFS transporter [Nitrospirillum sp. BR 11164]
MSAAAATADQKGGASKADSGAWLAVAAGTIGALMATLDVSIVNAALPLIQGEVGASGSEGTWISTAYLVAEIVMIALAGWFVRLLGLRTFLLIVTTGFVLSSMACGISSNLVQMIIGRVGQGMTGGAMIPTAMTIVSTRLPPSQQPVGIAMFGATAVLGPVLGPAIGGYLAENVSWHYAFFLNLPIGLTLLGLLTLGLPSEKGDWGQLADADWLGILGLTLGLGCLTTLLEEGQRERWFESDMINTLAGVSIVGFVLLIAGQFVARRPVIRLSILASNHSFAAVFVMSLVVGGALYGLLYLIPQYLANVQGYNPEQSGYIAMISGVPTLMLMPFFPVAVRRIDVRLAVAMGLGFYGISCMLNSHLTPDIAGPELVVPQLLRGVGQFFSMLFLNQAATASAGKEHAEDASCLFNAARNLGGSFGLAVISTLLDQRDTLHINRIGESVTYNSPEGQAYVAQLTQAFANGDLEGGRLRGLAVFSQQVAHQANVLTFSDLFWLFGMILFGSIPLVLMMRPLPKGGAPGGGH